MMTAIVYVLPFLQTALLDLPEEELASYSIIMSITMIAFLAPFPALSVYALSKDALWIWKSAPDGERSFLLTKWKQSLIVGLVYIPVPIIIGLWAKTPWDLILIGIVGVIVILSSTTSIGLFVSTYNPAYDVEGSKIALNLFIIIGIIIGILAPTAYFLYRIGFDLSSELDLLQLLLIIGGLMNIIGAILMKLAIRKLTMLE